MLSEERQSQCNSLFAINHASNIFFRKNKLESDKYALSRNISPSVISSLSIGYCPVNGEYLKWMNSLGYSRECLFNSGMIYESGSCRFSGRITIPICREDGLIQAFGGRAHDNSPGSAKYINSAGSLVYNKSEALFGANLAFDAIRKNRRAIIVEGYFDVAAFYTAGMMEVVAPCGTSLTEYQLAIISSMTEKIYVMFDNDNPGDEARVRADRIAARLGLKLEHIKVEGVKDPGEMNKEDFDGILRN